MNRCRSRAPGGGPRGRPRTSDRLAGYSDSLCEILAPHDRMDEAIAMARKAVEMVPIEPYLHNQLGTLLTRREGVR